ncbi:PspC domain-containing protein [Streptomyces albulus]|nr:PspC domain-containing protein [Streptomyces noursei]
MCGGLGRQWDIDPVIFRVVLAVLSIGGLGLIFYGFAWLLVPLDGEEENEGRRLLSGRVDGSALTALLCALAGCALFLTTLGKGSMMSFALMVTLAVAGAAYWSQQRRRAQSGGPGSVDAATAQAVADAPPETTAPPAPNTRPGGAVRAPSHCSSGPTSGARRTPGSTSATNPPTGRLSNRTRPSAPPARTPRAAPSPTSGRPTAAGASAAARSCWPCWPAPAPRSPSPGTPRWPRPPGRPGLRAGRVRPGPGAERLAGPHRRRHGLPDGADGRAAGRRDGAAGRHHRRLAAPHLGPDHRRRRPTALRRRLRRGPVGPHPAPLKPGSTVRTGADVGAGRLQVTLPQGTTATLRLSLGVGDIQLPGDAANDVEIVAGHRERQVTLPAEGLRKGERPHGALELDLKVGAGQIDVRRAAPVPRPPLPGPDPQGAPQ